MEVVAMSRLVGEKTRQQRQTKRRSSKMPIAGKQVGRGGETSKETRAHIHDEVTRATSKTRGFYSEGFPCCHGL